MNENKSPYEQIEVHNPIIDEISNFKTAHTVEDEGTGTKVDFKYVTVRYKEDGQIDSVSEGLGIQSLEDFKFEEDEKGRKVMRIGKSLLTNKVDAQATARLLSRDHGEVVVEKDGSISYTDKGSTNGTNALVPFGVIKLKKDDSFKFGRKQTFLLPLDYSESDANKRYQLAVVVSNEKTTDKQTKEQAKKKSENLTREIKDSYENGEKVYPSKILQLTESAITAANSEDQELYYKLHQEINGILQTTERHDSTEIELVDGGREVEVKSSGTYQIFSYGVDFRRFSELVHKKASHPKTEQDLKIKLEDFIKSIEPKIKPEQ